MIEDYILLYNVSAEDLVKEINTYLPKGYEPYGAPFLNPNDGEMYQAMIKHKEWDDESLF
jgi:hypothetical protein